MDCSHTKFPDSGDRFYLFRDDTLHHRRCCFIYFWNIRNCDNLVNDPCSFNPSIIFSFRFLLGSLGLCSYRICKQTYAITDTSCAPRTFPSTCTITPSTYSSTNYATTHTLCLLWRRESNRCYFLPKVREENGKAYLILLLEGDVFEISLIIFFQNSIRMVAEEWKVKGSAALTTCAFVS